MSRRAGTRRSSPRPQSEVQPEARASGISASAGFAGAGPGAAGPSSAAWTSAALVVAAALALFLPLQARTDRSNWRWGINLWSYFPPRVAWTWTAIGLAALVAGCALAWIGHSGGSRPARDRRASATEPGHFALFFGRGSLVSRLLLAAGTVGLFWAWRERVHFLGDTLLRLQAVQRLTQGMPGAAASALHAAPLDYLLLVQLPARLARAGLLHSADAAQLIPCFLGGAFVAAALYAVPRLAASTPARLVALALLVTQGYAQLFAGYTKGYGLQITALLLWCGAALREQEDRRPPLWSAVWLGVALLAHRTSALLLPAQVWLYVRAIREGYGARGAGKTRASAGRAGRAAIRGAGVIGGTGAWIALAFAAAALAVLAFTWGRVFLQDRAALAGIARTGHEPGDYSLLSAVHAANVANDLFLLAPLGLLALLLAPLWKSARAGLSTLLAAAVPFWLLALLVRNMYPGQGAIRDWDNFAPAGLLLSLVAARLLGAALDRHPRLAALAAAAVLAGAIHTGTWLALNARPETALARVEDVGLGRPPLPLGSRAMLYDYLGQTWAERQDPARSAEAYLEAASLAPNARFFMLGGLELWDAGQHVRAAQVFHQGAARDAAFRERVLHMTETALRQNPSDSLSLVMRRAVLEAADADSLRR